ncbi:MAG TPA: ROK family protein [Solirubrobacterales bacterium]|nr:ROK family protein [Solirubrobacterales bacterium]
MSTGGIEVGGTKWVCAVADPDGGIVARTTFPTTTPDVTISQALEFFRANGPLSAIGIGAFGPIDLHPSSRTFGHVTTTPKPGWAHTDLVSPFADGLEVPVVFETDVNAAAFGEWRRGSCVGLDTFCYVTVGTGIGGGAVVNGRLLHGLMHPELGHVRVPHDWKRDPFMGSCPYHGDCLEGLASGPALLQRWGQPAELLSDGAAWDLEAEYLALGLANVVHVLAPQRIVVGGGVAKQARLLPLVRSRLREVLAGYLDVPPLRDAALDSYVVPPGLGDLSGVIGAIELARGGD